MHEIKEADIKNENLGRYSNNDENYNYAAKDNEY
jgi:hypothetical protein